MALVVSGLLNKQIGDELGISEITEKAHRGLVMRTSRTRVQRNIIRAHANPCSGLERTCVKGAA